MKKDAIANTFSNTSFKKCYLDLYKRFNCINRNQEKKIISTNSIISAKAIKIS